MFQILFFVFLSTTPPNRVFVLGDTVKDLDVAKDHESPGMISNIVNHKDQIIFVSEDQLNLWSVNLKSNEVLMFGGKGEGPGELSNTLRCLWIDQNQINITHRQGFRWDKFDLNGRLVATETIHGAGELWYAEQECIVSRIKGDFLIQSTNGSVSTSSFSKGSHGINTKGVVLGNFLLITTTTANDDTISYKIIDTKKGTVHREDIIKKWFLNHENGLPKEKLRLLKEMGAEPQHFFVRSVTSVVAHPDFGFLLLEFSIHERNEPHEQFSIIHRIDPRENIQEVWRVNHKDRRTDYLYFPLDKDHWLIYGNKLRWSKVHEETSPRPSQ